MEKNIFVSPKSGASTGNQRQMRPRCSPAASRGRAAAEGLCRGMGSPRSNACWYQPRPPPPSPARQPASTSQLALLRKDYFGVFCLIFLRFAKFKGCPVPPAMHSHTHVGTAPPAMPSTAGLLPKWKSCPISCGVMCCQGCHPQGAGSLGGPNRAATAAAGLGEPPAAVPFGCTRFHRGSGGPSAAPAPPRDSGDTDPLALRTRTSAWRRRAQGKAYTTLFPTRNKE